MYYWIVGVVIVLIITVVLSAFWLWSRQSDDTGQAVREFELRRETLEARFLDLAMALGKPRGLRWKTCDWKEPVYFARDRETGLLTAFASVEISFEAIEGGDMEDVAAVGDLRDASAVFHYQHGVWGTGGRALFNMSPQLAVEKLIAQYEPIEI